MQNSQVVLEIERKLETVHEEKSRVFKDYKVNSTVQEVIEIESEESSINENNRKLNKKDEAQGLLTTSAIEGSED